MSDFTFKDNTDLFLALLKNRKEMIAEAIGDKMGGYAKDTINTFQHNGKTGYVDTGRAKGSITNTYTVSDDEMVIYVGSNVKYFAYLEVGTGIYAADGKGRKTPWMYTDRKGVDHWTWGIKPSHALQNSIADHIDEYKKIAIDGLKGLI